MKRFTVCLTLLALSLLTGCHHVNPFATANYQHEEFPVRVRATADGRIVSRDWLVDEWSLDVNERPVRRAPGYGRLDLVLRHRTNQGRMWLDLITMDPTVREQELRVLAQQTVSSGNSQSYRFGNSVSLRIVGAQDIALDGHAAHIVIVEGGVGQGAARGALVFARANYQEVQARRKRVVPVLLVAGYANAAVDFEPGLADFQRFLESVEMAPSHRGFTAVPTPTASPASELSGSNPATTTPQ